MERWIRLKLADEMGILAGVTITSLMQGVITYCNAKQPPSKIELTIKIEQALAKHLDEPLFRPVKQYLQGKEKRRIILAKHLAHLFLRYSIYGVKKWNHPWQQKLWKEIGFRWAAVPTDKPIHLFGFSHIPDQFYHLFHGFFYILSPCKEFWSEQVDHPLLANLGYVGRQLAAQIEDSQIRSVEDYAVEGLTPTQESMLQLGGIREDPTIEFHVATSLHREVEICYNNLIPLFPFIKPRDILVMAPNISDYATVIQAVFGTLCQITDLPKITIDLEVKGLWLLLELEQRRFSAPALLELFRHPLFQKKRGWNEESVLQIRKWMLQTGMRWGVDETHRKSILGISQSEATIKQGIDQLLEDLAYGSLRIDLTSSDLLGVFANTIDTLYAGLKPLYDGTTQTIQEWVSSLKALYENHFSFEKGTLFASLDQLLVESKREYSGQMLMPLLEEVLKVQEATYNLNEVEAVRFCSLLPMRAIPAKVIYLLGMNQDRFPRQAEHFSLDELKNAPSQTDLDRYLFLEALLSYREKLFISYLDTQEEPASTVLQKLKAKTIIHPIAAHDESYFTKEGVTSGVTSYSQVDFSIAQALRIETKKEPLFHPPQKGIIPPGEHHITLSDLQRLIRSPLSHYYHDLNFYQDALLKEEEEFTLSPLLLAKMRRLALKMPLDRAINKLQQEGSFPIGSFAQLAKEKLTNITTDKIEIAYTLSINSDTKVHLTGVVEGLVSEAFFRFDKPTLANAIKYWPEYLLCTTQKPASFILENKTLPQFFTSPDSNLKNLITYYFQAESALSPLFPNWIDSILKGDGELTSFDAALGWALQTKCLTNDLFTWKEVAHNLFAEMKDAWF